ncbi:glutaredoxin family protein [Perlucidibaca piscinae]|uniref:glutaredoxin family protein n=1 Tax=Perlucidibaca piscinae TaxID=392589 RepID=UPI0003B664E1|nr:glutaredoxin family protein [Perlucidibaca piscinae]
MSERQLTLLGTRGCHLCDEAEALLRRAGAARRLVWQYRDIALDETLVQRYGERIPVLLNAEGRELGWPFSLLDILRLAGTP